MRVAYDKTVDAAYIYLREIQRGEVENTYPCDVKELGFELNLDFDRSGHLVGIEVQSASRHLPKSLIKHALNGG